MEVTTITVGDELRTTMPGCETYSDVVRWETGWVEGKCNNQASNCQYTKRILSDMAVELELDRQTPI